MKRKVPIHRILLAFIVLPFAFIVIIPVVLHRILPTPFSQGLFRFNGQLILAFFLGIAGLSLLYGTNLLFIRFGSGTLAPWSPPERLVIRGPYRYMRQPMISGVILVLTGEFFLVASWAALAWLLVFTVANMIYIPLVEEKALFKRFGNDYVRYKKNVPGWIPRLHPWKDKE